METGIRHCRAVRLDTTRWVQKKTRQCPGGFAMTCRPRDGLAQNWYV
ncbi:Uncharacterised protein [Bordetella pertussis]|nr:Uncharacterised protein [Bordetella pertussis]